MCVLEMEIESSTDLFSAYSAAADDKCIHWGHKMIKGKGEFLLHIINK